VIFVPFRFFLEYDWIYLISLYVRMWDRSPFNNCRQFHKLPQTCGNQASIQRQAHSYSITFKKNIKDLACNDMVKVKELSVRPIYHISFKSLTFRQNKSTYKSRRIVSAINRLLYTKYISANINISADHATPNISVLISISQQTTIHQTYQW